MENNSEELLLFLDFEKAFDSVEWNILFKVLQKFNFGDDFIGWIKILYNKPIFRIKNNGWISKTCYMNKGIRKGCPISALLYYLLHKYLPLNLNQIIK